MQQFSNVALHLRDKFFATLNNNLLICYALSYSWGIDFKRSTLSKGYILLPPGLGNWEVLYSLF